MERRVKSVPGKILIGQLAVTLLAAALWWLGGSGPDAVGALAGGSISLVLTSLFALRAFAVHPDAGAQAMLSAFVRAEATKLVLAVVLFSAAAIFLSHVYIPLISTFLATLAVNWLALLLTRYD
jgi:F0F1-type ATP synthase assembly protein I